MATSEKASPPSYSIDPITPNNTDLEHGSITTTTAEQDIKRPQQIQQTIPLLRKLRRAEEWLDSQLGIELRGIDRVPEDEKQPPSEWNMFLLWWSNNIHVGTLPLGVLGPEFGLSLKATVVAGVVGSLLGSLCPAFTGTLGPRTGLRQIAISRYAFGFMGAKLCSILNIMVGGGWFVVNLVVVGQVLSAVSDFHLSIEVGIVIIAVISYVISVFGFSIIHTFEKYSWILAVILMAVLSGQAAPLVRPDLPGSLPYGSLAWTGSFLSLLAVYIAGSAGWCSYASDYTCHYPSKTPRWNVFAYIYWGIAIPCIWSIVIGALLGNIAIIAAEEPYAHVYDQHGLGGLLLEIYRPRGWSKFSLVMLIFTVLGNNVVIMYSSGLSLQLLGHHFHAVPRLVWTLLFEIVVAVLAIVGRQHLSNVVSDFVSLLGYWAVSFTTIVLIEDQWFRRSEGYDLLVWDQPEKLPVGIAAVLSLLAGYLAGGLPGMAQEWYVGAIARHFGPSGGDVGVYMSVAITAVVYFPLRKIERRWVKR